MAASLALFLSQLSRLYRHSFSLHAQYFCLFFHYTWAIFLPLLSRSPASISTSPTLLSLSRQYFCLFFLSFTSICHPSFSLSSQYFCPSPLLSLSSQYFRLSHPSFSLSSLYLCVHHQYFYLWPVFLRLSPFFLFLESFSLNFSQISVPSVVMFARLCV